MYAFISVAAKKKKKREKNAKQNTPSVNNYYSAPIQGHKMIFFSEFSQF